MSSFGGCRLSLSLLHPPTSTSSACMIHRHLFIMVVTELSISFQLSAPTFAVELQTRCCLLYIEEGRHEALAKEIADWCSDSGGCDEGSWNQPWVSKLLNVHLIRGAIEHLYTNTPPVLY